MDKEIKELVNNGSMCSLGYRIEDLKIQREIAERVGNWSLVIELVEKIEELEDNV